MSNLTVKQVEAVLGRKQYKNLLQLGVDFLSNKKILITGANGSIGNKLFEILGNNKKIDILATDITGSFEFLDITDIKNVVEVINSYDPDYIVNLAGAKHAPEGEHETSKTLMINTIGTKNLLDAKRKKTKLILSSTCKSANPEIVYGATKLIAERMTLNAGGSVARFFNVVETSGNVFEIWNKIPKSKPIDVAPLCERHFISLSESVGLILFCMKNESGRYIVNSGPLVKIGDVADRLYPDRKKNIILPRRGDRLTEKFLSSAESIESYFLDTEIIKVKNLHD